MTTYDFYSDPSHGWLKVPIAELKRLGIANKISRCSYMRGKFAYLEEDADATLFVNTKKARGEPVKFREHIGDKSSKIRSYHDYVNYTPVQLKEMDDITQKLLSSLNFGQKGRRRVMNASLEDLRYWKKYYKL